MHSHKRNNVMNDKTKSYISCVSKWIVSLDQKLINQLVYCENTNHFISLRRKNDLRNVVSLHAKVNQKSQIQ